MMSGLFLEDLYLGQKFTTDPVTISESEIIAFAEKYDPQPFHIDKDSAEKSVYGGLIASGFQTIAIAAGQWLRTGLLKGTSLGGPGMKDISWLAPVRPGDVLNTLVEITDCRVSKSRSDRGIVHFQYTISNKGGVVAIFTTIIMVRKRN
ncbi:MAG: hypothetical protein CFH42_00348 [Alphaproteobacteria bacterium MarineAlpha12_Bin1]|jgi:acyl dehydratase|nr:MAG: hypothetical protein CFH42_00348 [Alphaproteobacteria bacterium MarineAlpha12_Bin1]|tara:strand:- start:4863 stop:5309 length:447 start_codon:yes stop_codon:yes gene_type:complete